MSIFQKITGLAQIDGVTGFLLVNRAGELLSRSSAVESGDELCRLICDCAERCDRLSNDRFRFLQFTRRGGEKLVIIHLGASYLGVFMTPSADMIKTLAAIRKFFKKLTARK